MYASHPMRMLKMLRKWVFGSFLIIFIIFFIFIFQWNWYINHRSEASPQIYTIFALWVAVNGYSFVVNYKKKQYACERKQRKQCKKSTSCKAFIFVGVRHGRQWRTNKRGQEAQNEIIELCLFFLISFFCCLNLTKYLTIATQRTLTNNYS